jgi:hypothetical protein
MFGESLAPWFGQFETGEVAVYTSVGDTGAIIVPTPPD